VGCFQLRTLAPGDCLLKEGEPGGHLYVLMSGAVDVEKADRGDTLTVTRLGPGDVVGEISLLTRRPATATVRARGKTLALALARDDFNAIVGGFPEVLAHLYQLAVTRERDLERFLSDAIVEADDYLI
jgi:CRP-like cAMP-binding protein